MSRATFDRSERLSAELRRVLAETLSQRVHDPRLASTVVTDVKVTRDLSLGRVYYYSTDPAPDWDALEQALGRVKPLLRRAIADAVRLRTVPNLVFHKDQAIDTGRRMDALLQSIASEPEPEPEPVQE